MINYQAKFFKLSGSLHNRIIKLKFLIGIFLE